MFKLQIFDLQDKLRVGPQFFETEQEALNEVLRYEAKPQPFGWGLKDRWISESQLSEEEKLLAEDMREVETVIEYFFPKNYRVEITDLTNDYDYLLSVCYKNRKEAYGSLESQADEQFHDFDAWKARIAQVKLQFPKP